MVGHSFGLVSAVYNYNRRSAAINEILVKEFGLAAFSFYDDKYGFEPKRTVQSAHRVAQAVHWWLGALYDQKKLQLSTAPTIHSRCDFQFGGNGARDQGGSKEGLDRRN